MRVLEPRARKVVIVEMAGRAKCRQIAEMRAGLDRKRGSQPPHGRPTRVTKG